MITPAYSPTATERVLPRLALDFTTGVLDNRVTVTRALNTATRVNSSGYIEIVNANLPRFDYDPITKAARGLLIEETRSNLINYSDQFNNAYWSKDGCTITPDATTSPDGTTNADSLNWLSGTTVQITNVSITVTAGTSLSFSCYMKAGTKSSGNLILFSDGSNYAGATYNLATGVAAAPTGIGTRITSLSSSMVDVGNGWYRCIISCSTNTLTSIRTWIRSNTATASGDNIYIWGAQLEAGSFATSYIPTAGSSLTRNADNVDMTGTNFSSWFNASAGTFSASFEKITPAARGGVLCAGNFSITGGNDIAIDGQNNGYIRAFIERSGGIEMLNSTLATYAANTPIKAAVAYATNNAVGAAAATLGTVDTSVTLPVLDGLQIGALRNTLGPAAAFLNGRIANLFYWPQRLLNAELQAFTK